MDPSSSSISPIPSISSSATSQTNFFSRNKKTIFVCLILGLAGAYYYYKIRPKRLLEQSTKDKSAISEKFSGDRYAVGNDGDIEAIGMNIESRESSSRERNLRNPPDYVPPLDAQSTFPNEPVGAQFDEHSGPAPV